MPATNALDEYPDGSPSLGQSNHSTSRRTGVTHARKCAPSTGKSYLRHRCHGHRIVMHSCSLSGNEHATVCEGLGSAVPGGTPRFMVSTGASHPLDRGSLVLRGILHERFDCPQHPHQFGPFFGKQATLTPQVAEDLGARVSVRVSGTRTGYAEGTGTSLTSDPVVGPNAPTVSRLSGSSRYRTNDAVNAKFGVEGGPRFVATGVDFADALPIGPVVGITGRTLFLVPRTSVDPKTLNAMKALSPSAVYVVGGTGAVSPAVVSKVKVATGKNPLRVSGLNRYDTSEQVHKKFFVGGGLPVGSASVATGRDFPDALSAAARHRHPCFLARVRQYRRLSYLG